VQVNASALDVTGHENEIQMLGWHIAVFRQADGGAAPATAESAMGTRIAVWQSGVKGVVWLRNLIEDGEAIQLLGGGYPDLLTTTAAHLLSRILDGPPEARFHWALSSHDLITDNWEGRTLLDHAALEDCRPDEWLLVVIFDES
jgi:hypothetical protein